MPPTPTPTHPHRLPWLPTLALLATVSACTTTSYSVEMPPVPDSYVHVELTDDGAWMFCIDPNPYLEPGSEVTVKNLSHNIWVGFIVAEDGSFCTQPSFGSPPDLIEIAISSPSGNSVTVCYVLTDDGPVEDPSCGESPP